MMNNAMNTQQGNPWRGLKAYQVGETIYGRDEEIRSLTQYVMYDRDTVLYGRSGIGKSSIINAGIIPVVADSGMTPVYIRLEHSDGKDNYVEQIRYTLEQEHITISNVCPLHDADNELLWELFHANRFTDADGRPVKLLIILDQFEEIFTLQKSEKVKRSFFDQLADLLNDVKPRVLEDATNYSQVASQSGGMPSLSDAGDDDDMFALDDVDIDIPDVVTNYVDDNEYHFVFTLREDFLSDFEYYTAQIPSLKNHRFGLRPINEEQAADIILKPRPGLVSREVAKLIIEKITGRTDFELDGKPEIEVNSAILSLYMSRLYETKSGDTITAELVEEKGGEIIKDFYADSIASVPTATMEQIEDELINEEGRRENKLYTILCNNVGKEYVDSLIDCQLLRTFSYSGDIRVEFIHDILCPIIRRRKDQRENERKQAEERRRQEEAQRQLMQEKEQLAEQARLSRRRSRRIIAGSALVVVALAVVISYFYFTTIHEYSACYAAFKRIDGWPVGVGKELTDKERKQTPLYYRLSRTGVTEETFSSKVARLVKIMRGRVGTYTDVEVMSSNPRLPLVQRVNTPEVDGNNAADRQDATAMDYYDKLKRIKYIHFVAGENNKIDKEVVSDEHGNVLFVTSYFHLQTAGNNEAWLNFLTAQGQSMKVRDNGVDRIKIAWDSHGQLTSMMYYDEKRACKPVTNGIYGNAMRYCADGSTVRYLVDEYGQPTRVLPYNTIATCNDGKRAETVYACESSIPDSITTMTMQQVLTTPARGPEGYTRRVSTAAGDSLFIGTECVAWRTYERDDQGNITLVTTEPTGTPASADFLARWSPYKTRNVYDSTTGYQTSYEQADHAGYPFAAADSIYKKEWSYAANGSVVSEKWFTPGRCCYSHTIETDGNVTVETLDDAAAGKYIVKVDTVSDNGSTVTAYYGRGGAAAEHEEYDDDLDPSHDGHGLIRYHRIRRDNLGDGVVRTTLYAVSSAADMLYYSKERKADADGNTLNFRTYDADGRVIKSMMYFLQDGQRIARAVMGVDGTPVRCPNWEADVATYYKLYQATDINNNLTSVRPVNEFGDISFFGWENVCYDLKYISFKGIEVTIGGYKREIVDYGIFSWVNAEDMSSVSAAYLHILSKDSRLYKEGLRDGDRIISLGRWRWGDAAGALAQEWAGMRRTGATITVARPDGTSFRTIQAVIIPGSSDADEYHLVRLTNDEYEQLRTYVKQSEQ